MQNQRTSVGTTAQKSSKSRLLFRHPCILAMLLLCAVFSSEAQTTLTIDSGYFSSGTISLVNEWPKKDTTKWKDTVAVTLLVCDTVRILSGNVFWIKAYSVRNGYYENVDVSVNPNTTTYLPGGGSMTTLLAWIPRYEKRPFYTHLEYLDDKKLPLSKSVIVWQSVSK